MSDIKPLGESMDPKTIRKYLRDYSAAHRDLQLTDAAIEILERVNNAQSIIAALKRKQQVHLRRMDSAAEKIGAPWGYWA
jgi:hypothetical protein